MEKVQDVQEKRKKVLLIVTRVFASLLALFFFLAFGPKFFKGITDIYKGEEGWEGIVMMITFLVFIAGFIISWWKKCLGAAIILLASIIQMGPFLIIDGNLGSLIFGIPLFIVGLLFLLSCAK